MVVCLEQGANDLHIVQLMPLPHHHLLLHQNPVPAYPGCPGNEAVKRVSIIVISNTQITVMLSQKRYRHTLHS